MNALWDVIASTVTKMFNFIGFWKKNAKLVFLGLDNAGKTTLLHRLKDDRISQCNPTLHPTSEELAIRGLRFNTFDLGGHEQARKVWKNYIPAVDAIFFIVDASDTIRLNEAAHELQSLLQDEQTVGVPIVILGNKIDKPGAASEEDLRHWLGIAGRTTGASFVPREGIDGGRPIELFMCSILKRQGYIDAFIWLEQYLD